MPKTSFRRNLKSVATLALPLALTQLSQHSMSFVDTVFIGRVGELELASTALGSSLFFTTCIIGFGILHGLDTIIAQAFGRQEPDSARRALVQGTYLAFIWSFLTAGVAWLLTYATRFIGTDLRIAEGALEYMEGRLPSILPMFLVVALRSFLQGAHITRPILSAAIVANIVNLILDALVLLGPSYAFQFGWISENWNMEFGPWGLAVVSSIASFVQLLVMYGPIKRHFPVESIPPFDAHTQRLIFRIGFPLSIQLLAEIGVFSTVLILISRIDAASTAAHQVALSIASLTFAVCLGIGAATSVAVGRAVGAGERRTMVESGFAGILLGIGFMSVTACLMWLFPRAVSSTITTEASVLALASQLIIIAGFFQIVDGIQAVAAGALRGLGLTRFSSIANLLGHWAFGLPLGLWLAFEQGYGVVGLWWGLTSGLTVVALALTWKFVQVSRRDIASFRV